MTALKIAGITAAALAVLIIILLLMPAKLCVSVSKEKKFSVTLRFAFIKIGGKKGRHSVPAAPEKKETPPIIQTVKETAAKIKDVLHLAGGLIKKCRVDKLYISCVCANENAALAALDYGAVCAVLYPLCGFVNSAVNIKNGAVKTDISCDYNTKQSNFSLDFAVSLRLIFALIVFIKYLKEKKNEKGNSKP